MKESDDMVILGVTFDAKEQLCSVSGAAVHRFGIITVQQCGTQLPTHT